MTPRSGARSSAPSPRGGEDFTARTPIGSLDRRSRRAGYTPPASLRQRAGRLSFAVVSALVAVPGCAGGDGQRAPGGGGVFGSAGTFGRGGAGAGDAGAAAPGGGGAGSSGMASGGVAAGGLDSGGAGAGGGGAANDCAFTVTKNALSTKIPTVGIVEWALAGPAPSSATIVYTLKDAPSSSLNRGGEAPVDLDEPGYRTLLLGLKQAKDYGFRIEASRNGQTCVSPEYALPTTGSFESSPSVTVTVVQPEKREPGFIVTSSGSSLPSSAFILDADGEVVWYVEGPQNPTRALMDYEGEHLWMLQLNLLNQGGEMRFVSMDGEQEHRNVPGLENAHHDFTVMPGGKVAAIAWRGEGIDPESEVLVRSPDGTVTSAFRIGSNLYRSEAFHANAIHYIPFDDGFTISDRNPNLIVKVRADGTLDWQLSGSCEDAPAGERCSPQRWDVNHGHHLLPDGTFVLFNNSYTEVAHVLEFRLNATPGAFTATLVRDYAGDAASTNLGDVQRLPRGNTLITYATDGKIVELDASWNVVQTFSVRVGYSSFRPTLYGPPARL